MEINVPALVRRINRKLANRGEKLRKTRGERWRFDLGDYYVIDLHRNIIVLKDVDSEELAKELGVLRPVPTP